ncbi:hypothetical protein ACM66B_000896 [Microbotryomycetes sp. NB124-2]
MSSPKSRLQQVSNHLDSNAPLATRFRPKLPAGLAPSNSPLNPCYFLLRAAQVRPNHLALWHFEKNLKWTYEQWATRVCHLAYALKLQGINHGDRVLVLGPNVPFVADALQAIPAVQGVIVAVNTRLNPSDVEYIVQDSGAKLVLVDGQFESLVKNVRVPVIVCQDSGQPQDPYEQLLQRGAEHDRKLGAHGWSGLEMQRDELATFAISYTSGTTSRPKGVETTYRGTYLAGVANAIESGMNSTSVYLWILPMFHCLGWCYPWSNTMSMSTQLCLRQVGDYNEVWKSFLERGVTHYCGAPTVQLSIATHKMARTPPQLVKTTVAGAAPTATLIKQIEQLGFEITHVYGLTETYGPMTQGYFLDPSASTYYEDKARQGHAFRMADDIRVVKLIQEGEEHAVKEGDLQEVAFDGTEVGEIVMRGNLVMKGYWNNKNATDKAFAGGYFHTGDLAVRRPDGTFAIQDRSKDIIISGGENISSLSIESALSAHPDVLEVACVARSHEKWGERPHAFVVLREGSSWHGKQVEFEKELKKFSRGKMPAFAIPEWVELVPALEKTSTGKIQKHVLRDKLKKLMAKL